MGTDQAKRRVSFTLSFRSHARLISPRFRCRLRSYRLCDESAADEYYSQNPIPSIAYTLCMTPATASSAAATATAGGNHYYANISQQHDQCKKNTCSNMATDATQVTLLIDYNFARKLDYRWWRRRRWSCGPCSTAKPAPPPSRHATACVPSSHSTEIYVFSKAKETDFCLAALLVATARHYNSILSCYLVIRVGE